MGCRRVRLLDLLDLQELLDSLGLLDLLVVYDARGAGPVYCLVMLLALRQGHAR